MSDNPSQHQTYQPGDICVTIGDKPYRTRLTLGALSELSERLGARGPSRIIGGAINLPLGHLMQNITR